MDYTFVTLAINEPISEEVNKMKMEDGSWNKVRTEALTFLSFAGKKYTMQVTDEQIKLMSKLVIEQDYMVDLVIGKKGETWTDKKTGASGVYSKDGVYLDTLTLKPVSEKLVATHKDSAVLGEQTAWNYLKAKTLV